MHRLTGSAGRVFLVACAAVVLGGCGSGHPPAPAPTTPAGVADSATGGLRGLVPTPKPVKPVFSLVDTSGHAYDFAKATGGKLTYLFFGYTHCPDACPATMSFLEYAIHQQPAAVRRKISVVFVTVDPHRDSGPVLRRWLDHYNRGFVGLTGTPLQIETVERAAGVPVATLTAASPKAAYEVEHSSLLFAYSPDDQAHVVYSQGFKPTDYAHDIPLLLAFKK